MRKRVGKEEGMRKRVGLERSLDADHRNVGEYHRSYGVPERRPEPRRSRTHMEGGWEDEKMGDRVVSTWSGSLRSNRTSGGR